MLTITRLSEIRFESWIRIVAKYSEEEIKNLFEYGYDWEWSSWELETEFAAWLKDEMGITFAVYPNGRIVSNSRIKNFYTLFNEHCNDRKFKEYLCRKYDKEEMERIFNWC